jgi:hypothetical protein
MDPIILLCEEWKEMHEKLNDEELGTIIVSGQPGIGVPPWFYFCSLCLDSNFQGKTYFLYYVLIRRLLDGMPTILQAFTGHTYLFEQRASCYAKGALSLEFWEHCSAWALVDADNVQRDSNSPDDVLKANQEGVQIKIIVATPPRMNKTMGWLDQVTYLANFSFAMYPWSWTELYIVGYA